ncbi:DUF397 domain-containing protein [Streptomyces sp. JJ66]|uniref:DUF397 domain-containing protein n=1 Tax=Streptomyces sp. JJ66 TaxID=2803843 RepID=UPI001C57E754|nr:DUF397 domain-containing protein [Streptomyces sp. JJ66]MBW1601628.1 DUF397 domain-containing protein [Streptomyces sp. JJ66]
MIRHNLPEDQWRTSSYSADNGGQCVEVQLTDDGLWAVGDSKDRTRGAFTSSPLGWDAFIYGVKAGSLTD